MSSSSDDRSAHLLAQDDLAEIAVDDHVGAVDNRVAAHLRTCSACQAELARLRRIVTLARDGGRADPADSPGREVWQRIAAQADLPPRRVPTQTVYSVRQTGPRVGLSSTLLSPPAPPPQRRRRVMAGVAAAVVLIGIGLGGWALGRTSSPEPQPDTVVAQLAAQPGTSAVAAGTATMLPAGSGYEMQVSTTGLPAPSGFYEVWLYDPDAGRMVAIGTLGPGGRGSFTLPSGLDVRRYGVVDVSAQRYDGDPRHQRSVLRGPLDR